MSRKTSSVVGSASFYIGKTTPWGSRVTLAVAMGIACSAAGCSAVEQPADSFVSWEEFRDQVYREPNGGAFIVEGDIPIWSEEELKEYYDEALLQYQQQNQVTTEGNVRSRSQHLTVRHVDGEDTIWSFPRRFELTYCVDDFGDRQELVESTMKLAANSWSKLLGTQFSEVDVNDCSSSNSDVVFNVSPAPDDAGYNARAFYPDYSRDQRELLIADDAFTTTSGGRDFEGILRHELGHALGFRHEHIWIGANPTVRPCTSESTDGARLINEYDEDSVMHYPQCRDSDDGGYRQTELDYHGGIELYGLAPAILATL